jgi:ArsR family transcriptional regulator
MSISRAVFKRLPVGPMSRMLKALGDERRLRIVALLAHDELCVCHLQLALGMSQPKVSKLLWVLRRGGVVESKRKGRWVYYRLGFQTDALRRAHLATVATLLTRRAGVKTQVKQLMRACGPASLAA